MLPIYEITAAPHFPHALRAIADVASSAREADAARELLADGIILTTAAK